MLHKKVWVPAGGGGGVAPMDIGSTKGKGKGERGKGKGDMGKGKGDKGKGDKGKGKGKGDHDKVRK